MDLNDRLVRTCIKILRSISDKSLSINKIIEQTSPDRKYVIEAIKTVERAKLVKRSPSKNHKQMKILELGHLGNELVNLMKKINEFRESYRLLTESINKNFNFKEYYIIMKESFRMLDKEEKTGMREFSRDFHTSRKRLINKQRAKGWTDTEILSYRQWFEDADIFQYSSARAFIAGLFTKYMSLSLKSGSNEVSRAILTKIVMDALNQHLTDTYNSFKHVSYSEKDEVNEHIWSWIETVFSLNSQILQYLEKFSEDGTVHPNYGTTPPTYNFVSNINNRFIGNDAQKVMKSIASMFEHDEWVADDTNKRDSKNSKLGHQSYYQSG